uniref:Uncharacterized protein n=1 Tax=viral metagenome TaxID=1070528 RepID=A0A6C0IS89_9ZZZZ
MSTKKTIQINPELFKLSGNKTKKSREKKDLSINSVITPNNLKNKLLKRIKDHKTKEIQQNQLSLKQNVNTNAQSTSNTYTDEFNSAMDYLSDLSKQKQRYAEKERYKKQILNKTIKNSQIPFIQNQNHNQYQNSSNIGNIMLDLPPELEEPFVSSITDPIRMNYKYNTNTNSDVPYGCLKNGFKPSYRTWIQTRKNYEQPELNPIEVRPPTPPKKSVESTTFLTGATYSTNANANSNIQLTREDRLEKIRNKLRLIDQEEINKKRKEIDDLNRIGKELGLNDDEEMDTNLDDLPEFEERKENVMPELTELLEEREKIHEMQNPKNKIKKTIKRKFTLGRSEKLRKVAILVKDKKTRKNILNTQKELKKMHINDVRKYLRQHGIIKAGTTCPPDILRKTFEMAMLAGEVTNVNKDVILHNFMNPDKI